jgi:two-component system chemotaxis sensor kinase CheA
MAEMDPELIELFKEESFERLGRAVALIGEIRAGRMVQAAIEEIDRELHTIKGSVKMLGFAKLGSFVHEVEAVSRLLLEAWQRGQLDPALVDLLEEACDEILRHIEIATESGADSHPVALMERVRRLFAGAPSEADAEAPGTTGGTGLVVGASPESKPPRPSSDSGVFPSLKEAMLNKPQRPVLNSSEEVPAARTESGKKRALPNEELVRVRSSKLASLDALVSDLIDSRLRLDHHEQSLRGLLKAAEEVERAGLEDAKALYSQFREDRRHLDFIVKGLEQLAIDLRLRPLSRVFDQVARVARDLARRFGKSVNIEIHGENTELDRVILDGIQDPLHHIIRNVVDHGVELPEQRLAAGKPEAGHIELSANQEGGAVVIRISDDGAGVDTAKLKARVVEKGLLSADAVAEMSHQELIDLVFIPGLSTRTEATETSGRGVGMDVVRRNVEALKGEAHINSSLGQGTIIELRVPLTLLVSRVLLVRAGGSLFAIPTEALDSTESLRPEEIAEYAGQTVMRLRGRDVPIVPLSKLMNLPDEDTDQRRRVAVVRHKEELLALDIEGPLSASARSLSSRSAGRWFGCRASRARSCWARARSP